MNINKYFRVIKFKLWRKSLKFWCNIVSYQPSCFQRITIRIYTYTEWIHPFREKAPSSSFFIWNIQLKIIKTPKNIILLYIHILILILLLIYDDDDRPYVTLKPLANGKKAKRNNLKHHQRIITIKSISTSYTLSVLVP